MQSVSVAHCAEMPSLSSSLTISFMSVMSAERWTVSLVVRSVIVLSMSSVMGGGPLNARITAYRIAMKNTSAMTHVSSRFQLTAIVRHVAYSSI